MLISLLAMLAAAQAAPATPPAAPLPSDPAAGDWKPIPDDELLVITLAGNRTVVIRLAPSHAPEHVANVRRLAQAKWWDGESVYRVQEGWVAQWGDASEKKPLPGNVVKVPAAEYDIASFAPAQRLARADAYSTAAGITADGWSVATDGAASWIPHCYGTVGVARDSSPDTGSGSELFTPIGQAARRLDRNYTIVGRIIEGMQYLSALPRSDAPLGVYATARERTPIVSVRLASDLPPAQRPHFVYRSADNVRFSAMLDLRLHPKGMVALGGVDVCDVPLAVRRVGAN
ncbi:peptidylprolyl isomerase [Sphingomonas sp. RT2P30]|uniref:peptidylprolyl isomerase n=1 Tax=Parasphingomonas halimpatiens TaxID=3096162 RepID=UPI002FCC2E1A